MGPSKEEGFGCPSSQGTDSAARGGHTCAIHLWNGQDTREEKASQDVKGRWGRPRCPEPIDRGVSMRDTKHRRGSPDSTLLQDPLGPCPALRGATEHMIGVRGLQAQDTS